MSTGDTRQSMTTLCTQVLGLTRRLSAKRTFLSNVMHQVEQHGDAHAKVIMLISLFSVLSGLLYMPGFTC